MSTAKKIDLESQGAIYADIFINEMEESTGCSRNFLEEARPAIERLFTDVQGDALESCLDDIRLLIQQQAQTERHCQRAKEAAEKLAKTQAQMEEKLISARKQLIDIRDTLKVATFNMYARMGNATVHEA